MAKTVKFSAILLPFSLGLALPLGAEVPAGTVSGVIPAVQSGQRGALRVVNLGESVIMGQRFVTDGQGSAQLLLADGSSFTIGPNSELVIDRFVYNPEAGTAELAASATRGVFRFIGGAASKSGEGVKINTPVGTAGIRGSISDFAIGTNLPGAEAAKADLIARFKEDNASLNDAELQSLLRSLLGEGQISPDSGIEPSVFGVTIALAYGESIDFTGNDGLQITLTDAGAGITVFGFTKEQSEKLQSLLAQAQISTTAGQTQLRLATREELASLARALLLAQTSGEGQHQNEELQNEPNGLSGFSAPPAPQNPPDFSQLAAAGGPDLSPLPTQDPEVPAPPPEETPPEEVPPEETPPEETPPEETPPEETPPEETPPDEPPPE